MKKKYGKEKNFIKNSNIPNIRMFLFLIDYFPSAFKLCIGILICMLISHFKMCIGILISHFIYGNITLIYIQTNIWIIADFFG